MFVLSFAYDADPVAGLVSITQLRELLSIEPLWLCSGLHKTPSAILILYSKCKVPKTSPLRLWGTGLPCQTRGLLCPAFVFAVVRRVTLYFGGGRGNMQSNNSYAHSWRLYYTTRLFVVCRHGFLFWHFANRKFGTFPIIKFKTGPKSETWTIMKECSSLQHSGDLSLHLGGFEPVFLMYSFTFLL